MALPVIICNSMTNCEHHLLCLNCSISLLCIYLLTESGFLDIIVNDIVHHRNILATTAIT